MNNIQVILNIFVFIVIILVTFFFRIYTRIKIKYYGDDTWIHMLWADYLRRRTRISQFHKFSLIDTKCDYPLGLAKILSFFKKDFCERYQFLFSPLIDTLNVILVFSLALYLSKNLWIAIAASIFYAVNPALVFSCSYLGPRPLGYLFFNITLSLLLFAELNILNLLFLAFFAALVMNTHKMATQAVLFLLLCFSVIYKNFLYLSIIPLIFITALIISKGYYWEVLKGHLRHIKNHIFYLFSKETRKYPQGPFTNSLLKAVFWGFILVLFYQFLKPFNIFQKNLFFWAAILYFIFVLTTFLKPLQFLGQGYRYLEYAMVPFSILMSQVIVSRPEIWYITVPLFLFYISLSIKKIFGLKEKLHKDYTNILDKDRFKVFDFLKKSSGENIFCLPSGMSNSVAYFARKKILWPIRDWDKVPWLFPYVKLPISFPINEIIKKYKVDFILLHKQFAKYTDFGVANYSRVHNMERYQLIEF